MNLCKKSVNPLSNRFKNRSPKRKFTMRAGKYCLDGPYIWYVNGKKRVYPFSCV